jgi:hypothetical protein
MLTYRVRSGEGISVIDGHGSGPPFLWRANDARGTNKSPNMAFNGTGFGVASRNIAPADPSATSLAAVAGSELLVSYERGGSGYWAMHTTLGQPDNPITFERNASASIDSIGSVGRIGGIGGGGLPLLALTSLVCRNTTSD